MQEEKEIFTIIGELYVNYNFTVRRLKELEKESQVKDSLIKDMREKLNANIGSRNPVPNPGN